MSTGYTAVSTVTKLSASELDLVGDAVAVLFFRNPDRRGEILAFAKTHPELHLFHDGEPSSEEEL